MSGEIHLPPYQLPTASHNAGDLKMSLSPFSASVYALTTVMYFYRDINRDFGPAAFQADEDLELFPSQRRQLGSLF